MNIRQKQRILNPLKTISERFKYSSVDPLLFSSSYDISESLGKEEKDKKTVIVTGLDIGTTKICAIVGEVDEEDNLTILGIGIAPSKGMKKGLVVDIIESSDSIKYAIQRAEKMAKVEVKDVFVGIAGGHIQCLTVEKKIVLSNKTPRPIMDKDINRVINHAKITSIPIDREIILCEPLEFYTDDGPKQNLYGGLMTKMLGVKAFLVTASVVSVENLLKSINRAGYQVADIYLQPLASGLALLNDKMRETGLILIDIGGGTSDIAIYFDDNIRFTATVPYAGDNITYDLKKKYGVTFQESENLKKRYGTLNIKKIEAKEILEERGPLGQKILINRKEFCGVIGSRLEEILQLCKDVVITTPYFERLKGGVILTGGTSLIEGIDGITARIFCLPTIVEEPKNFKGNAGVISSPIYSTAVGLVHYGARVKRNRQCEEKGFFKKAINRLKDFIDWYN